MVKSAFFDLDLFYKYIYSIIESIYRIGPDRLCCGIAKHSFDFILGSQVSMVEA